MREEKKEKETILNVFIQSGEFELKQIHSEVEKMMDPCCPKEFSAITYHLLIWRLPTFFLFNYIQGWNFKCYRFFAAKCNVNCDRSTPAVRPITVGAAFYDKKGGNI